LVQFKDLKGICIARRVFSVESAGDQVFTMYCNNPPLASSDRLEIYSFSTSIPQHAEFLYTLWTSPHFGPTSVDSPAKAQTVIENRFLKEYKHNGYGHYILALKPNSSTTTTTTTTDVASTTSSSPLPESIPIGTVCLTRSAPPPEPRFTAPDIGFALLPAHLKQGYASEGASLLLRYAKEAFGQRDVLGFCDVGNRASRRVMERAGFVLWGEKDMSEEFGPGAKQTTVYALKDMEKDWVKWGIENSV
jgi:RimJ/RimL family protein N-acetyltransferase